MSTVKPDLTRVWAKNAPSQNVIDPDTTQTDKFINGWQAEVPTFEHFNFLQKLFTQGLAHNNEQGINVWDTDTTYPIKGLAKGSDGVLYEALVEQNGNNPVSDGGTNWIDYLYTGKKIFRANSAGDIMDLTNLPADGGATLFEIFNKADAFGAATPNIAAVIHNYRPNSIALQLDATNTGSLLSLTNSKNLTYGTQFGSSKFINLFNNRLPEVDANWSTNVYQINDLGYVIHKNYANYFLDWDDQVVSTNGFKIDTNLTWDSESLLQLWSNNGVGVASMSAAGVLQVSAIAADVVVAPSLDNSWVNFGGGNEVAGFWTDKEGNVHIHGMVKSGTINQSIFTLPAGSRPAAIQYFLINSNNGAGSVIVGSDGTVVPNVADNTFVSLSGIIFRKA